MNFKLVSKQNIGIVVFLISLIFISQSRIFDFLFYTALGRAFFIFLLLLVSYLNKIVGVVMVLLAIIMINNKDEIYFEAFGNVGGDASGNRPGPSGNGVGGNGMGPSGNGMGQGSGPSGNGVGGNGVGGNGVGGNGLGQGSGPSGNGVGGNGVGGNGVGPSGNGVGPSGNGVGGNGMGPGQRRDASGNVAAEGFDLLGTENNLKRGKKSNSIPVNNSVRKSGNVDPYYNSSFGSNYTQF